MAFRSHWEARVGTEGRSRPSGSELWTAGAQTALPARSAKARRLWETGQESQRIPLRVHSTWVTEVANGLMLTELKWQKKRRGNVMALFSWGGCGLW